MSTGINQGQIPLDGGQTTGAAASINPYVTPQVKTQQYIANNTQYNNPNPTNPYLAAGITGAASLLPMLFMHNVNPAMAVADVGGNIAKSYNQVSNYNQANNAFQSQKNASVQAMRDNPAMANIAKTANSYQDLENIYNQYKGQLDMQYQINKEGSNQDYTNAATQNNSSNVQPVNNYTPSQQALMQSYQDSKSRINDIGGYDALKQKLTDPEIAPEIKQGLQNLLNNHMNLYNQVQNVTNQTPAQVSANPYINVNNTNQPLTGNVQSEQPPTTIGGYLGLHTINNPYNLASQQGHTQNTNYNQEAYKNQEEAIKQQNLNPYEAGYMQSQTANQNADARYKNTQSQYYPQVIQNQTTTANNGTINANANTQRASAYSNYMNNGGQQPHSYTQTSTDPVTGKPITTVRTYTMPPVSGSGNIPSSNQLPTVPAQPTQANLNFLQQHPEKLQSFMQHFPNAVRHTKSGKTLVMIGNQYYEVNQ